MRTSCVGKIATNRCLAIWFINLIFGLALFIDRSLQSSNNDNNTTTAAVTSETAETAETAETTNSFLDRARAASRQGYEEKRYHLLTSTGLYFLCCGVIGFWFSFYDYAQLQTAHVFFIVSATLIAPSELFLDMNSAQMKALLGSSYKSAVAVLPVFFAVLVGLFCALLSMLSKRVRRFAVGANGVYYLSLYIQSWLPAHDETARTVVWLAQASASLLGGILLAASSVRCSAQDSVFISGGALYVGAALGLCWGAGDAESEGASGMLRDLAMATQFPLLAYRKWRRMDDGAELATRLVPAAAALLLIPIKAVLRRARARLHTLRMISSGYASMDSSS